MPKSCRSIYAEEELWRRVERHARRLSLERDDRVTLTSIVREALEAWLEREEAEPEAARPGPEAASHEPPRPSGPF